MGTRYDPRAVFALIFALACESFAFYGVRSILMMYLSGAEGTGGLGWDEADALELFGLFMMALSAAYVPGGFVADRITGPKYGVLVGGLGVCAGCFVLALPTSPAVYGGLGLVVLGAGLMKPSLWITLGRVYLRGDGRIGVGFALLLMGINLGSFLSGLSVGSVEHHFGAHYGFILCGLVMLGGLGIYAWGLRYLREVGNRVGGPKASRAEAAAAARSLTKADAQRLVVFGIVFVVIALSSSATSFASAPLSFIEYGAGVRWISAVDAVSVLLLALPVAYFWAIRNRRSDESSSIMRIGLGTAVGGWGFVAAAVAVLLTEPGTPLWIGGFVMVHLLLGLGQVITTPAVWGFLTKLAPVKYATLCIGSFFAALALASALLTKLGEALLGEDNYLSLLTDPSNGAEAVPLWAGVALLCTLFGAGLVFAREGLKPLEHGAEEAEDVGADESPVDVVEGAPLGPALRLLIFALFLLVVNAVLFALDAPFWIY